MDNYVYELWMIQGQGGVHVASFKDLEWAKANCNTAQGSFAIKMPDGTWYNWDSEKEEDQK